jgi:hypothetical protein
MTFTILVALAAVTAAPAQLPRDPVRKPPVAKPAAREPAVDPLAALGMMTKIMDKFFPAGPPPDPARLAAARSAVGTMFPPGAYAKAMTGFFDTMIDRGLTMSEADFAALAPAAKPGKGKKAKPPSTLTFRQELAAKDPNFDAKLAAVRTFMGQTMIKLGAAAEPALRDGMARSLARKFDVVQIAEINAFLATPTGRLYGREMVGLWFEPDVIRGTFASLPEMMRLLPGMMQDVGSLESQIKALEKPKPAAGRKTS